MAGCECHAPLVGYVAALDGALDGWGSTSATLVTRDTTTKRSGAAAVRCNSGAGNAAAYAMPIGNPWSSFSYFQVAIRVDALPGSTVGIIRCNDSTTLAGSNQFEVKLTSAGLLQLFNGSGGAQIGASSSAISTNTWYVIEFKYDGANIETRIDGATWIASTSWGATGSVRRWWCGWHAAPGANKSIYFDDLIIRSDSSGDLTTTWINGDKVVMALPISDVQAGSWTGGAGGTTNLYDAINNTPPIGTATETNLTQIESADTSGDNSTDEYRFNMTTYTNLGISSTDIIKTINPYFWHGEDAGTGTKTGSWGLQNPAHGVQNATFGSFTFGDDQGALGTWPSSWALSGDDFNNASYDMPTGITKGNSPVGYLRKTDTGSRVASVCFFGLYIAYQVSSGTAYTRSASDTGLDMSTADSISAVKNHAYTPSLSDRGLNMGAAIAFYDKIGTFGSGNNDYNNQEQMAYDGTSLWVADEGNNRFKKVSPTDLSYLAQKTIVAENSHRGICSDGTYVYTTESDYNPGTGFGRIEKYDIATLTLQLQVSGACLGAASPNSFLFPFDICTNGTYLWVCDSWNQRVVKLLCSDLSFVAQIGSGTDGIGNNDLSYPLSIDLDSTYLYIIENGNGGSNGSRLNKRLISTGAYDSKYGSLGSGNDQIGNGGGNPRVAVSRDGDDRLYIADATNDRVVVRKASDLTYVTQFGTSGTGDSQFTKPTGIVAVNGYVFVQDAGLAGRLVRWTAEAALDSINAVKTPGGGGSAEDPMPYIGGGYFG